MYNFGSFDAFIVKPTIMPDFARNLLHCVYIILSQIHDEIGFVTISESLSFV